MTKEEKPDDEDRLSWHPAFFEAIQMELDEYSHALQFIYEYQLTTEPLRIDVVIIKKIKDIPINKNIASIFRKDNIVEYKSPSGNISVKDFYKVYGYACIYLVLNGLNINDLSITFVESYYPRDLLIHLEKERGYEVEEKWPGIYIIKGDIIPIQIIDNRNLSEEENIWIKNLDIELDKQRILNVTTEIHRQQSKAARLKAYLDILIRANEEKFEEALKMSDTMLTLEQILEKVGLTARWEARGREQTALNMIKLGYPMESIVSVTQLDSGKVKELFEGSRCEKN